MLVNRAIEAARRFGLREVLLRRRAAARADRTPVVLVPPMLGTRLRDERGRRLWGWTQCLYAGPSIAEPERVVLDGVLEELALVPGVVARDVHGGLIRYLEAVGGYRRGEDLAILEYDWRRGVAHGAACLADLVGRMRGAGDERVNLLCASSGGLVARWFMAYGSADVTHPGAPAAVARQVRRVVYLGTPHRGSLDSLKAILDGFQLAPYGRHFDARDVARCQTAFDLLTHPAEPVAVGADGRDVPFDLHDAEAWRAAGLCTHPMLDLGERLARARALHLALDRAPAHPDTFVIGARHMKTRRRLLLAGRRLEHTPCCKSSDGPDAGERPFFGPGDGTVTIESMHGAPGLDPSRSWVVTPSAHRDVVSEPETHRLVLEALLATDRAIPKTRVDRAVQAEALQLRARAAG